MNSNSQKDFHKRNIAFHGEEETTTICMEECSELIKAISKCKRYGCNDKYRDSLVEEIADVLIIIGELKELYNLSEDEIEKVIESKIARQESRMENSKKDTYCNWIADEFCTNHDCPYVADFCPVTDSPEICKYAEKIHNDDNLK
jgi:NTP pyrophosphatase (non-canonical NTP hydrolase)